MPQDALPIDPSATELAAAVLQGIITLGLGGLFVVLHRRHRKPYFLWFAIAWLLYALRVSVIIAFLLTEVRLWLYWHQVITGWTALALLWASLVFSEHVRWHPLYFVWAAFPVVWSFVAIYTLDNFLLAAGPAVGFLSAATAWTGATFLRFTRRVGSASAAFVGWAFILWAIHHLDYPFLRARGAWAPWGYYLDILFVLAVGIGVLLVVLDDLNRGVQALTAVSRPLPAEGDVHESLLANALTLPGVSGSALYLARDARFVAGAGVCATWERVPPAAEATAAVTRVVASRQPEIVRGPRALPSLAILPVARESDVRGAFVLVSEARNPFAALDHEFLLALGRQVDATLENADLTKRLASRTASLERLAASITEQHEADRRRLARELHDETAQVFSAVRLKLGALREDAGEHRDRLDAVIDLVDTGVESIRTVTDELRPSVLDELGLPAALRALGTTFADRTGLVILVRCDDGLPHLTPAADLAFYRAAQEGLANAVRHAGAKTITLRLSGTTTRVTLEVRDDGNGLAPDAQASGGNGLAYMRERFAQLGGMVEITAGAARGTTLRVEIPVTRGTA